IFQGGLAPSMIATLMVSLAAFTTLYCLLLIQRVAIKQDEVMFLASEKGPTFGNLKGDHPG
ncbi:MAG: hypothetical protein AABZ77_04585, partial [Chloroflexota bacterium]